jgi:hypothetical protein
MKSLAFFLSPAMALLCSEGAIHPQRAVSLLDGKKTLKQMIDKMMEKCGWKDNVW